MSNDHVIKNLLQFEGVAEEVDSILKELKSDKSLFDFNKIEAIDKDKNDVEMNDYINACLNVYMHEKQADKERFIKTCTFVGRTREVPYEFKILTPEQLNSVKSKNKTEKMLKDAESFLDKVRSKSIFNGYMVREAAWGTGSGAANIKIKGNQINFETYDLPPVKVIEKLAAKNPNIRIIYAYAMGKFVNRISIKGEYKKDIIKNSIPVVATYSLITQNVSL
ncbi:MAG: hypothetical protein J6A15_08625 [Clostridia bacterium]|nr:hypothetical protein [Clostridia bacterium]MBP3681626.1 hypothetical protein [Clostridia bacterium]